MADHCLTPPSSANRWVWCPASVAAGRRFPDRSPEGGSEGQSAHALAARCLLENRDPQDYIGEQVQDTTVDRGTARHASVYVGFIRRNYPLMRFWRIETPVSCESIHPNMFGTPDFRSYDPTKLRLSIVDFKYGWGLVEVYQNWSLLSYAIGAIYDEGLRGFEPDITVELTIVQPRPYHPFGPIRTWELKATDLRAYRNRLADSASLALSDSPPARVGPHCQYCSGLYACETAEKAGYIAMDVAGEMGVDYPDDAMVSRRLEHIERLEQYLSDQRVALEQQIESRLLSGKRVPGYKIGYGPGTVKWSLPPDRVAALGDAFGVDIRKPPETLTPKQAINAGLKKEVVDGLTKMHPGKRKVVKSDDAATANLIFGGKQCQIK